MQTFSSCSQSWICYLVKSIFHKANIRTSRLLCNMHKTLYACTVPQDEQLSPLNPLGQTLWISRPQCEIPWSVCWPMFTSSPYHTGPRRTTPDPVIVDRDRCLSCVVIWGCLVRGPGGEPDEPEAADGLLWDRGPAGLLRHVWGPVASAPAQGPHRSPRPQGRLPLLTGTSGELVYLYTYICSSYVHL